jgi:hypothetical protein
LVEIHTDPDPDRQEMPILIGIRIGKMMPIQTNPDPQQ